MFFQLNYVIFNCLTERLIIITLTSQQLYSLLFCSWYHHRCDTTWALPNIHTHKMNPLLRVWKQWLPVTGMLTQQNSSTTPHPIDMDLFIVNDGLALSSLFSLAVVLAVKNTHTPFFHVLCFLFYSSSHLGFVYSIFPPSLLPHTDSSFYKQALSDDSGVSQE